MKTLVTALLTSLLALFILFALPSRGEEAVYENTLRLHVLAASDSTEDQTAKLLVRDAVLRDFGDAFLSFSTRAEAEKYMQAVMPALSETVESTLREHGIDDPFTLTLAEEHFDTRTYGDVTLPSGKYTALKITIGEGAGQNFWCMLYPALCVAPALGGQTTAEDAYGDAAYQLVTHGYAVRFRTLELLSAILD